MTPENITLKGDRVMVKQLSDEKKVGSFYIPDSVIARKSKRRKDAWKAEVISLGDMVDHDMLRYVLKKGDIVYVEPVALDCPGFEGEKGERIMIITDEDIIAKETTNDE